MGRRMAAGPPNRPTNPILPPISKRFAQLAANPYAVATTVLLIALLCAIVAYWAMQLLAPRAPIAPVEIAADARASLDLALTGRLFGSPKGADATSQAAESSNIRVIGVAASALRPTALLSVDGKPAKPFALGDRIDAGTRLVAIKPDAAVIDRNGATVELKAPGRPTLSVLTQGVAAATDASRSDPRPTPGAAPALAVPGLPPHGAAARPPALPATTPGTPTGMPQPIPAPGSPSGVLPPQPAGGASTPPVNAPPGPGKLPG